MEYRILVAALFTDSMGLDFLSITRDSERERVAQCARILRELGADVRDIRITETAETETGMGLAVALRTHDMFGLQRRMESRLDFVNLF